ncbi:MAG: cell wall anchor protein [Methylobacterium sp.]|uniref:cell wall anchor protein n=1 Tax=Methylobacterium sp. TaxID=409 RepID=UPI000F9FC81C|nr:cell wall anchor protein [Methylobacterium sp.]RUP13904.1 MAG: cell wall anchor protein [Methylobacterium sp.]
MSANAVMGSSLQRDLVSALRQARAANTARIEAGASTTAGQDPSTTQATGSTGQTTGTTSTPTLSNDLMASLLQLQSDFSQMGLQSGVTTPADATANADEASATGTSSSPTADGAAPVHHRRGHHGHRPASDATQSGASAPTGAATDGASSTSASTGTTATADAASATGSGDGLQSFLQQVTKAIAAYATGGPVGIAAALTSSTQA